ncbi:hypothetical protein GGU11DRAFT_690910 [Lentinula aff. detonsa]|nr:hypothetical protein GGU11DRAFT_690910 [Lentinula aff. detonsa]
MLKAFARANQLPKHVDYFECHATGTAKGDPTEANWIGELCSDGRTKPLWIGSIKGNIGHTEIVSFLASLAKVLLIFRHTTIPPNANFHVPNPAIQWDKYHLQVPTGPEILPTKPDGKSLVAISSSGIGGTNAHVVLENFLMPEINHVKHAKYDYILLAVGGLSPKATAALASQMAEFSPDLALLPSLAVESFRRARQMPWRSFIVMDADLSTSSFSKPVMSPRLPPHVVFVFSGQGPQYSDMGRQFFHYCKEFKESILLSDQIYQRLTGESLIWDYGLFGEKKCTLIDAAWPSKLALPAIAIFQIALFDLTKGLNIVADSIIGHSAGETAALYASGAGSREMTIALSIARGTAFSHMEQYRGTMAALSCNAERAHMLIQQSGVNNPECIAIACYNSPSAVAVSGPEDAIEKVLQSAQSQQVLAQKLNTRVPVHSPMMELIQQEYVDEVEKVFKTYKDSHIPKVDVISTVTGCYLDSPFTSDYFWRNAYQPVLFMQALETLSASHPQSVFIEIGPNPVLTAYISHQFPLPSVALALAHRHRKHQKPQELHELHKGLGKLFLAGHSTLNLTALYSVGMQSKTQAKLLLPDYPLLPKNFPLYPHVAGYQKQIESHAGPLNHPYLRLNQATHPLLAQHIVCGEAIMPASGFLEMAFEFGATSLYHIAFHNILSMSASIPLDVNVSCDSSEWTVKSSDKGYGAMNNNQTLHAQGLLFSEAVEEEDVIKISTIQQRCKNHCAEAFYPSLKYALNYKDAYQRVIELHFNSEEAIAQIKGMDNILMDDGEYILHPAILDACFHPACFQGFHGNLDSNSYFLPAKIGRVLLHNQPQRHYFPSIIYSYLKIKEWTPNAITYDILILDQTGFRLCSVYNIQFLRHYMSYQPQPVLRHSPHQQPLIIPDNDANYIFTGLHEASSTLAMGGFSLPSSMSPPLFKAASYMHHYQEHGSQIKDFQLRLTGIDLAAKADIWVTAAKGPGADEASGLIRTLQKEYPMWTLRLVTFPPLFNLAQRNAFVQKIPYYACNDLELSVTETGTIYVPRIISSCITSPSPLKIQTSAPAIPPMHISVSVHADYHFMNMRCYVGYVLDSRSPHFIPGATVVGILHEQSNHKVVVVESGHVAKLPDSKLSPLSLVAPLLPGLAIATLAFSPSLFGLQSHFHNRRILLTHTTTPTGAVVLHVLQNIVSTIEIVKDNSISCLTAYKAHSFDFIISGHSDRTYAQIFEVLVKKGQGKVCMWGTNEGLLGTTLTRDPHLIGHALQKSLELISSSLKDSICQLGKLFPPLNTGNVDLVSPTHSMRDFFTMDQTYILLGGAGSIGPHIALWMYEHGARHIILTSRSGIVKLQHHSNLWALRVFQHLKSCHDLDIRVLTLDSADGRAIQATLLDNLEFPIGGCIILSASKADGMFLNLQENDFEVVQRSYLGVFDAFCSVVNTTQLDFIIAFSSVSAMFGNSGQANYALTKSKVDGRIKSMRNALSFVCPPIQNTTMVINTRHSIPRHSISDLIKWMDDAFMQINTGEAGQIYIPSMNWDDLSQWIGPSYSTSHLLSSKLHQVMPLDSKYNPIDQLIDLVLTYIDVPANEFATNVPLISYGLDSLSASHLSFSLQKQLSVKISQIRLLSNVTVDDMLVLLHAATGSRTLFPELDLTPMHLSEQLQKLYLDYIDNASWNAHKELTQKLTAQAHPQAPKQAVLLTGSTGTLGSHILHHLMNTPDVYYIYVLIRGYDNTNSNLDSLQAAAFAREGLRWWSCSKVKLINYNPTREGLGMDYTVPALEEVISFEDIATHKELQFSDWSGYLQSKLIAEHIVLNAGQHTKMHTAVVRMGQLTGGISGAWSSSQWFPALVKSGLITKCLPDGDQGVSWLDSSTAARIVVELYSKAEGVLHVVHPNPTSWKHIIKPVATRLKVPLVPYRQWLSKLKEVHNQEMTNEKEGKSREQPALTLVDFFTSGIQEPRCLMQSMGLDPLVSISQSRLLSATLTGDQLWPLNEIDANQWWQYWMLIGFLPR